MTRRDDVLENFVPRYFTRASLLVRARHNRRMAVTGWSIRFFMGMFILMKVLMKIMLFFQVKENIVVRPILLK